MPNTPNAGGISRKIISSDDRKKIRSIIQEIKIPKTMGLIVRTAGLNKTKNEINKDVLNTISEWEKIKARAVKSIAPSIVYEEGDIIKRAIRDVYNNEIKNIIVDGNEGYQKAKNFMKFFMPENVKKIKKYRGKIPLFHEVGIEKSLNRIFEPTVKLASGGSIVINPTEALVAIDINSGQSIKEINIEKTALKTNLEAAEEIARQIKIRDLSGLIVIDFIDMNNFYNRKIVERKLREKLKDDRARIQFGRISNFGLLEMTRQRLRESSVRWNMVLSLDSFSLKIMKKGEELAFSNKAKIININAPLKVKIYIEENLAKEINNQFNIDEQCSIMGESFIQWVVEDDFIGKRPALEKVGVQFVDNVFPYEEAKIRILNGGHVAVSYFGFLKGYTTYDQAINDPSLQEYFFKFEKEEVIPALGNEMPFDLKKYMMVIFDRFKNENIADRLERIAMDGVAKFPIFILPTIKACFEKDIVPSNAISSIASWYVFMKKIHNKELIFDYYEPQWDWIKKFLTDVKIDDFAAGDDNADLDSSTSRHGLLLKLGGGTTNFLRADGAWAAAAAGAAAGGSPRAQDAQGQGSKERQGRRRRKRRQWRGADHAACQRVRPGRPRRADPARPADRARAARRRGACAQAHARRAGDE